MKDVVIVGALRTPIGCFRGALAGHSAVELGSLVVKALIERTGVPAYAVDEVILGQVLTAGAGQNPARQSAIKGGLPNSVSAITINDVCGSGLKALHLATQAIQCGEADIVIAGGQENMSRAPPAHSLAIASWLIVLCMMGCGMPSMIIILVSPPKIWLANMASAVSCRMLTHLARNKKRERRLTPDDLKMRSSR